MVKRKLMKMPKLRVTAKMLELARNDKAEKVEYGYNGGYFRYVYQYGLFLRCVQKDGILKVAIFLPDVIRLEGKQPAYELYIDRSANQFLTFDRAGQKWTEAKLDKIDWPAQVNNAKENWISPADRSLVRRYLGGKGEGYKDILQFQLGVREDALLTRYRKETAPWDEDLEQIPPLPKDWDRWVKKVGFPKNYIIYEYDRKGVHTGYCTYCEKDVPVQQPHYGKESLCPCCHHSITYKSVGRMPYMIYDEAYMYLIQRCKDGFVIREFNGVKKYSKVGYKNPEISIGEKRRAIYSRDRKPLRAYDWENYKQRMMRWVLTGPCNASWSGNHVGQVYGRTIPDLARNELDRTGLPGLMKCAEVDPEKYLAVLERVPMLERIAKAGLPKLACDCISSHYAFSEMDQNAGLARALGITPPELKRLRAQNGGIDFLNWMKYGKEHQYNLPDSVVTWYCVQRLYPHDLRFISDRMTPVQVYNYVTRQMQENRMSCEKVLTTWKDYLSMAERFKLDLNDEIVYRVRKLKLRHDELVKRSAMRALSDRARNVVKQFPKVNQILKSIQDKYAYSGTDYKIVVPAKIEEILYEGDTLRHCVNGSTRYWERIERHESYLLFLRKATVPDKPYYTLEVEPNGTIRQLRTYYDRQDKDIDDARAFLKTWQKVVAKRLDEADRALAQASKVLREQEFIQMRKDQVTIHTGDLAGKLLVDVLTADLMENAA